MPYDAAIAERVRPLLAKKAGFAEKKMFGGVGFLLRGHMCVGVWKDYLIVRVGANSYSSALARPGAREFDITGRPMAGWVMVEPVGFLREIDLLEWVNDAVDFVVTLPAK